MWKDFTEKGVIEILIYKHIFMKFSFHNSLRALFLFLAVLLSLPMLAVEVEIDGINYELVSKLKLATVIKKSSGEYSGEVIIPESVEHEGTAYSVTSIGDYAFFNCSGLTSVTIPNSVTSIGGGAFSGCSGLTSVHISDIAAWCNIDFVSHFYSNPLEYAHHLYLNGEEVKDLVIPNSVTSIGSYAFYNFDALTSVTIGNSVTSIGSYAFYKCSGLTSVTIGNSVKSIGSSAFYGCSGLTSVTIGNSVTSIGYGAFEGCSGLTSVTIPNSVTSIGEQAFDGCSGLTSVTIGNSVTSIGDYAFYKCSGLTSVTIPNSVTSIGSYAFEGCSSLTSVTIPNSVTSIEYGAFVACSGLTSIVVEDGNPVYDSRNNCNAIIETSTNTLHSGCKTTIIPNSVTSIGYLAFLGCGGLTTVTIPKSVTSIATGAFVACSGLTSVTIPNSVTSIGVRAFYLCSKLLDVYCYAENVPDTYSDAFMDSPIANATLHVPDASIDSYKATAPWSSFGNVVGLSGEEPEQPEVPEVEKCATPVVTYADGKMSFSCETDGAEFVTDITDSDIKKHYDAEIEFSATYNIEVFATKANYENSDTVSVALVWVENGEVNEETGVISVPAAPVLVQGNGGILTVSGVVQNTEVVVYTIDGMEVDRAVASDGTATIYTGLQSGTIVVVKFGNKSVKVRI